MPVLHSDGQGPASGREPGQARPSWAKLSRAIQLASDGFWPGPLVVQAWARPSGRGLWGSKVHEPADAVPLISCWLRWVPAQIYLA